MIIWVLKFFFVISFLPCVPSYHHRLTSSRGILLNRSTALRDSATDIKKTSRKGAPEREWPNRSIVQMNFGNVLGRRWFRFRGRQNPFFRLQVSLHLSDCLVLFRELAMERRVWISASSTASLKVGTWEAIFFRTCCQSFLSFL